MTLRRASLIGLAILGALGAVLVAGGHLEAWQLVIFAVLFIIGILVERSTYRRDPPRNRELHFTGEVFEDPVSGKTVRVMYDPQTGERYYEDTDNDRER